MAIAIIGIPTCLFLFYAAIQKGIAETEADDAEYQRRNNRFWMFSLFLILLKRFKNEESVNSDDINKCWQLW